MPASIREYSDLNLSFSLHPVTGDVARLTGLAAVKRAVQNLVLTNFYERPFRPELACGVQQTLFEPLTVITAQKIQTIITDTIERYEPRVKLSSVIVNANYDQNGYMVEINFQVINLEESAELKFFLERIR